MITSLLDSCKVTLNVHDIEMRYCAVAERLVWLILPVLDGTFLAVCINCQDLLRSVTVAFEADGAH